MLSSWFGKKNQNGKEHLSTEEKEHFTDEEED